MIPSMGGTAIGEFLKEKVKEAEDNTAIVELGTWLGAGTEQLAIGVEESKKNISIHSYDWFVIRGNEVDKAEKFGEIVKDGQDSLPLVKKYLSRFFNVKINLYKGEITNTKWNGEPISIYIDDACKYEKNFIKALKIFSPYWMPGKTIIVLMDYYFHLLRPYDEGLKFQFDFVQSHKDCFTHLIDYKKQCVAAFRYEGGLEL